MPSFLREVLTAHELDELGLSDAIRNADVRAPKTLCLHRFFSLRSFLLLVGAYDVSIIAFIAFCHNRVWDFNRFQLPWNLEVSSDALTLTAALFYATTCTIAEILVGIPLRSRPYDVPPLEPRYGIHPWDIASCWTTFLCKLQIVVDLAFALDCFRADRSILGSVATFTLSFFYFLPRALLSAFSLSLLFRPTPPRTSIIDFIGSFFGVRASKRLPIKCPAAAISYPTLRSLVAPKGLMSLGPLKQDNTDLCAGVLVHRKQALGVSYPSMAYIFIKYFCYLRILAFRCLVALQSLSPFRWVRSSRDICRPAEEPLHPQPNESSLTISRLATKTQTSTISPDHTSSVVEVEMENRNHDNHGTGETLRRSRGFVSPGPNWMAGVLQATAEEGPTPDSAPEAESTPLIEFRGWRRQALSNIGNDLYGSILNTMSEIESVAVADDPKTVELAVLALTSEYYLTQDILKEEYVPPDFHEELEFLQTLIVFLRLHVTNLLLNLLRFHCLMSSSFKESADWFMLFGLLSSLVHGIFSFFYASYDQAVIDELMDDD